MMGFIFKKALFHTLGGAALYLIVYLLSPGGSLYAGFFAGLYGALFLLGGWLSYLRSRGTDITAGLRRKDKPEVPYYLRNVQKEPESFLRLGGARHLYDDDLEEMSSGRPEGLSEKKFLELRALAFLIVGIIFIILSFF